MTVEGKFTVKSAVFVSLYVLCQRVFFRVKISCNSKVRLCILFKCTVAFFTF